jgi:hypothetical protein
MRPPWPTKPARNMIGAMDKLQLTGRNLGRVFNSRSGCMCALHLSGYKTKWPNLKLSTRPKQLLGYLPLAFVSIQPNHRILNENPLAGKACQKNDQSHG